MITTTALPRSTLALELVYAPPGHPSAEQRAAVAAAERYARRVLSLHAYTLKWVHAPHAAARGCTRFPSSGPAIFLRDDLTPGATYRTMCHELQHVADAEIITELTLEQSEARAEKFAEDAPAYHGGNTTMLTQRIATGNGRCATCAGPITAGSTYLREQEEGAPFGTCRHLQCPPKNSIGAMNTSAPRRVSASASRACVCGGLVIPVSAGSTMARCWGCGRVYF